MRRIFRLYLLRSAASVGILACMSSVIYYYGMQRPGLEQPSGYIVAETLAGDIREIQLADGSVVWLNASGSLTYPRQFRDGTREVFLEGEAFFSIAGETTRPCIIHTADMDNPVLWARLNVQAYRASYDRPQATRV